MATRTQQAASIGLTPQGIQLTTLDSSPARSNRIYLASQSPRRRDLLAQLGVAATPLLPGTDEDAESLETVQPGESPAQYVRRVTRAKGLAAWQRLMRRGLPIAPILVADTTVALGERILGKPANAAEAVDMLSLLSDRWHTVLTAVALQTGPRPRDAKLIMTRSAVLFAKLTPQQISAYVATGEPLDKAGAYGIQGGAASFVVRIQGSYTGIIGLPLHETAQLLQTAGPSQHE